MNRTKATLTVLILLALALALNGGGIPSFTTKATAVTYVYEKDDSKIPNEVLAAIDKLNRRKPPVAANVFEQDTLDGAGETPEQYKVALAAAKAAGLPAAVSTAGAKVLRVAKNPQTEEDVLGLAP